MYQRIMEKMDLITHYDDLSQQIKYLIKDIITDYQKEITEWIHEETHKSDIKHYNIVLSKDDEKNGLTAYTQ